MNKSIRRILFLLQGPGMKPGIVLFTLILSFPLAAEQGEFETLSIHRSGTLEEPFRASPLSEDLQQFRPFLETGNRMVTLLKNTGYGKIYDEYFSDALKARKTRSQFLQLCQSIERNAGKVTSFKPNQWNFHIGIDNKRSVVSFKKLVEHKQASIVYTYTFSKEDPARVLDYSFTLRRMGVSSARNGQEYTEKPLGESVQEYRPLLETGNAIIRALRDESTEKVYAEHLPETIKNKTSLSSFRDVYRRTLRQPAGPIKGFKPMQWNFQTKKHNGEELLILKKIVHHEKGVAHYFFIAKKNQPEKLLGFRWEWGVARANQATPAISGAGDNEEFKPEITFRSDVREASGSGILPEKKREEFEPLMQEANRILSLLKAGEFETVYDNHLGRRTRQKFTKKQFIERQNKLQNILGGIKGFQEEQWILQLGAFDGKNVVVLQKRVLHERFSLVYGFMALRSNPGQVMLYEMGPDTRPKQEQTESSSEEGSQNVKDGPQKGDR